MEDKMIINRDGNKQKGGQTGRQSVMIQLDLECKANAYNNKHNIG